MEEFCTVGGKEGASGVMSMTEEAVDWMVEELISLIGGSLVLSGVSELLVGRRLKNESKLDFMDLKTLIWSLLNCLVPLD